jgi:hypothetical protein
VRNTVAIQDGLDPATARFTPVWRTDADGAPAAFFAGDGELGHWPGHGIRLPGGPLVVFLSIVRNTPGQGLGFASAGWRAVLIDDPDSPPQTWRPRVLEPAQQAFDAQVGAAVARDGEHVVALAPADSGEHATFVARFPVASLAAGELGAIQWWDGRGWTRALAGRPRVVIFEGATEASLHLDAALGRWVYVASRGFPASSIAVRTAPRPEGPWSPPAVLFTPPESRQPGAFVYAAKAHPELTAVGLAVTYADNSFDFADLLDPAREARLYWPHFATLRLRAPP